MLTWGALNIIGAPPEKRAEIEKAQREVAAAVDAEITKLGIEHDSHGNRAKAYLYCLEVRCPETGWLVPLSPSWVISKTRNVVAKLIPNPQQQRFDIAIVSGVSAEEMKAAELGTVQNGCLTYSLNGKTYTTPIKTLRGDYKDANGNSVNRLRRWEKHEFKPRPHDIFQERLYCIQWITVDSLDKKQNVTFFAAVTEQDLARERQVEQIVAENIEQWQQRGLMPDMAIEPGDKTDEPIRTRGWKYWHHLFNARQILEFALYQKCVNASEHHTYLAPSFIIKARALDYNAKLSPWDSSKGSDKVVHVFTNQALNTFFNYGCRGLSYLNNFIKDPICVFQ